MRNLLLFVIISCLIASPAEQVIAIEEPVPPSIELRILETTDLHSYMMDYDYRNNKETVEFGFARTASLIKEARKEAKNVLLFDNGDLIQGSALAELASKTYQFDQSFIHPAFKALNRLRYDGATLGNHEFNFGLDFLQTSLRGADFPYVNANIYVEDHNLHSFDDINYFNPYMILDKRFTDTMGVEQNVKVGVIGLITPIAAKWDEEHFKGKIKIKSMVSTLKHFIPIMKSEGADIIIVLAHAGLAADEGVVNKSENSVMALTEVEGIDAILYGHSHSLFPNDDYFLQQQFINIEKGTIRSIPLVQAGYWGNHLGIIDLSIRKVNDLWKVVDSRSEVRSIYKKSGKDEKVPVVQPDEEIIDALRNDHSNTLEYIKNNKE
ncbi:2',3'-cyclic-nucleotide 2'-phosphodiesterase/3'-nucleotidase precursor [Mycobacteroides abscessus subsp. abscessus]|nr:2',3'-cyclic-nucleotide 2'-phosphodiesterase/3'-nucleotidase precursor [Mycobacteroides abscessus subsp. abscessus]